MSTTCAICVAPVTAALGLAGVAAVAGVAGVAATSAGVAGVAGSAGVAGVAVILLAAGLLTETQALIGPDEQVIHPAGYAAAPGASVDYVGVIYKPTGNTITTEMGEQPEMAPLDGWHVNVRLSADRTCPEALQGAVVSPATPSRVWA